MERILTRASDASLPTSRLRPLVDSLYRRAGQAYCCDPRDLAEAAFDLRPCPTATPSAYVADDVLHYPERLTLPARGLQIYRLIALYLQASIGASGPVEPVVSEIVLPFSVARRIDYGDLAEVQPHVPLSLARAIYMASNMSGVMRAPG